MSSDATRPPATLVCIRGPLAGARLRLEGAEVRVGRAPENDIPVPEAHVSRLHAILRPARLGWSIEDAGSSGGTIVNGVRIAEVLNLCPNDEIRLGQSVFLFDSEFDLQNADFTDNSVYLSPPNDDTVAMRPVATLESRSEPLESPARQGMELLTEIGELFDSTRVSFGEALRATTQRIARILRADVGLLMLYDHGARELRASAAISEGDVIADRSVLMKVFRESRALLLSDRPELVAHPSPNAPAPPRMRSLLAAPLLVDNTPLGVIYLERRELDAYTLKDLRLVQSLGKLLGVFIEARQRGEALALKRNFSEPSSTVIGGSMPFRRALELIRRVAPTPATVLLIGETGSGKEVLAAEVHRLSPQGQAGRPYVAVNCAAVAESLFESELFGHEKGAFTGAIKMRQGYIEQAQGGTLFLDEIGELSPQMQPKLLRFLQEHTFTRVGGNRLLRADVRVVAATNRNLEEEVRRGRFREDLFHRLNVMPIQVPALRERRDDIRLLAEFFVSMFSKSLHREIHGISDDAVRALEKYNWPGNVRELANCLERAVLLADGKVLLPRHFSFQNTAPLTVQGSSNEPIRVAAEAPSGIDMRPLEEVEKEHILRVLNATEHNQVKASEILGIHRNTLRKKLQEWGLG